MTEKEALVVMRAEKYPLRQIEAVIKAIEALEKEIPKKITGAKSKVKAFDVETNHILTYECSPCPSCGKWITKLYKYCPHCGQRLEG